MLKAWFALLVCSFAVTDAASLADQRMFVASSACYEWSRLRSITAGGPPRVHLSTAATAVSLQVPSMPQHPTQSSCGRHTASTHTRAQPRLAVPAHTRLPYLRPVLASRLSPLDVNEACKPAGWQHKHCLQVDRQAPRRWPTFSEQAQCVVHIRKPAHTRAHSRAT